MKKNAIFPLDAGERGIQHAASAKPVSADPVADSRLNIGRSKTIKASLPISDTRSVGPIRILIVDDHPLVRKGLRAILTLQSGFNVVGEAGDGDEALRLATELEPDVMLLDFSMPKKSGLDVMRELNRTLPRIRAIVVTVDIEKTDLVKLIRYGVRGMLLKSASMELLDKCVRKVHNGEMWISREMMAEVVEALATNANDQIIIEPRDFGLTPREREIVRLIVEGESNKGIAHRLSIGQDTVKHHLTACFNKTGTSSRLELALFALDRHLASTH